MRREVSRRRERLTAAGAALGVRTNRLDDLWEVEAEREVNGNLRR